MAPVSRIAGPSTGALLALELRYELEGGRAGIDEDGVAVADHACGNAADPALCNHVHVHAVVDVSHDEGVVNGERAAVHALQAAAALELVEVAARGDGGDAELLDDAIDGNGAFLLKDAGDLGASLLHAEDARHLPLVIVDHGYLQPSICLRYREYNSESKGNKAFWLSFAAISSRHCPRLQQKKKPGARGAGRKAYEIGLRARPRRPQGSR